MKQSRTVQKKENNEMNDERKKKIKRFLRLSGKAIIVIIIRALIPYLLDRFFAYELYAIWESHMKRESLMEVNEWFGFLGSYLGAVGTIVIGIVAYMQTDIINKQS